MKYLRLFENRKQKFNKVLLSLNDAQKSLALCKFLSNKDHHYFNEQFYNITHLLAKRLKEDFGLATAREAMGSKTAKDEHSY